jgi:hypothetical protein
MIETSAVPIEIQGPVNVSGVQSITFPVPPRATSCTIYGLGTFTGVNATQDWSLDGGVTFGTFGAALGRNLTGTNSGPQAQFMFSSSGATGWVARVPDGATHLRVRITAITTGTVNLSVGFSEAGGDPVVADGGGLIGLNSSGNKVGRVAADATWQDDTATPLATAGVFIGTARDLTGTVAGGAMTGTSGPWGTQEIRALAVADVAGVLALEVSRDNTTWRRIVEEPTSSDGTGGLQVATVTYRPATRYARLAFTNGVTAQALFMLQSFLVSA